MPRPGMAGLVLALMVSAGGVGGFMHAGRGWAPLTRPSRSSPYSPWGHAERFSGTLATLRCLRARKERGGILSCGASTADVSSMKVAEIKNELLRRGVSSQGLFEKEELVRALLKAREEQSSDLDSSDVVKDLGGLVVPMKRTRARENSLGSEVRVDEKDYFSVVVSFPALQGTAAEFVIDTASTLSIVVPSFAARTQAKGTGRMASVNAATAGGQQLKQVSLGRTEIAAGGRQVDCGTLEPIVMDLPVRDGVAGLLGVDFLLRFDALFDLKEERVVLAPPSTIVSGATRAPSALRAMERAGLVEVPMFFLPPPAGFYVVKVKIEVGGKSSPVMSAVVDMGSTFTVINSAAARAVGVEEGSPLLRDTNSVLSGATLPGQSFSTIRFQELDADIKVGGLEGKGALKLGKCKCCVADLPAFVMLGMRDRPAMVLGLDVLGGSKERFGFSAAGKRAWISPVE